MRDGARHWSCQPRIKYGYFLWSTKDLQFGTTFVEEHYYFDQIGLEWDNDDDEVPKKFKVIILESTLCIVVLFDLCFIIVHTRITRTRVKLVMYVEISILNYDCLFLLCNR